MPKKSISRISLIGLGLTILGLIGMFQLAPTWLFFLIAVTGAVMYGGWPNWKAIRRSWQVSGGILLAAVVVSAFYVNQVGWEAFYYTLLDSVLYALVIATFVSGTIKKFFKDK